MVRNTGVSQRFLFSFLDKASSRNNRDWKQPEKRKTIIGLLLNPKLMTEICY